MFSVAKVACRQSTIWRIQLTERLDKDTCFKSQIVFLYHVILVSDMDVKYKYVKKWRKSRGSSGSLAFHHILTLTLTTH